MPKKTLREKLLAGQRREKLLINFNISQSSHNHTSSTPPQVNPSINVPQAISGFTIKSAVAHQYSVTNHAYVVSDLKRIIAISMFAFSIEGLLYFLLVKQFRIF